MASGTERHSSNVLEKFNITIKKLDNTLMQYEVMGYRISFADYPDAKLFVHKSHKDENVWCVSEETTGFQICNGASKPAAVGRIRRMLCEKYEKFGAALTSALAIKNAGKYEPGQKGVKMPA